MADSYVQLTTDQSGKKIQQFENTIAGNLVEAMAVAFQDATGWSNSFVEVAESTGKRIQYFQNTIAGMPVFAQAIVLVDTTGAPI